MPEPLPYKLTDPTQHTAELVAHNARVAALPDVAKFANTVIEREGESLTVTGAEIDGRKLIVKLATSWGTRHRLGYRDEPTLKQIEADAQAVIDAHIAEEAEAKFVELRVKVLRVDASATAATIAALGTVTEVGD